VLQDNIKGLKCSELLYQLFIHRANGKDIYLNECAARLTRDARNASIRESVNNENRPTNWFQHGAMRDTLIAIICEGCSDRYSTLVTMEG
jgi:hypothetical protein